MTPKSPQVFICYLALVLLLISPSLSKLKKNKDKTSEVEQVPFERYYLRTGKPNQCPLDSPAIFANYIALPASTAMYKEAGFFFAHLFERFNQHVDGKIGKRDEWSAMQKEIIAEFKVSARRVNGMWLQVVHCVEMTPLPWLARFRKAMILQNLEGIRTEYEYIIYFLENKLDKFFKGVTSYFTPVISSLKEVARKDNDLNKITGVVLLETFEKTLMKMRPSFIGTLLQKIFRKSRMQITGDYSVNVVEPYFMSQPLEHITHLMVHFIIADEIPEQFWTRITAYVLERPNYRKPLSDAEMEILYRKDDVIINCILNLLPNIDFL